MNEQFKNFKTRCKCANCGFISDYSDYTISICIKCGSNALDILLRGDNV